MASDFETAVQSLVAVVILQEYHQGLGSLDGGRPKPVYGLSPILNTITSPR